MMCLSIPKRIVEWEGAGENAGDFAWGEPVNMMLIGSPAVGGRALTSQGQAREVVEDDRLALVGDALSALAASLAGNFDPSRLFQDLNHPHD